MSEGVVVDRVYFEQLLGFLVQLHAGLHLMNEDARQEVLDDATEAYSKGMKMLNKTSNTAVYSGVGKETTQGIVDPSASRMRVSLPQEEEKIMTPVHISFEKDGMLYEGTAYYVRDVNDE